MSELDYDALQRLADAATPGPWSADCCRAANMVYGLSDSIGVDATCEDAEFIAASRSAIPALLDRVRELEAERDAALSTIAKVEALHRPYEGGGEKLCRHCIDFDGPWPCSTAAALGSVPSTGEGNE